MEDNLSKIFLTFKRKFHNYNRQVIITILISVLFCIVLCRFLLYYNIYSKCPAYKANFNRFKYHELLKKKVSIRDDVILNNTSLKYILLWTPGVAPFHRIRDRGRAPFLLNNCQYTNCYLTHTRNFFRDQTQFDAVLFSVASFANKIEIPKSRSPKQKFVIAATQPAPNPMFDNYFNWTWTYRLDSDVLWRYFRIYDRDGREVGPRANMSWSGCFQATSEDVKQKLRQKTKAVAWIVTDWLTKKRLEKNVNIIDTALKPFGFKVDIYGVDGNSCGDENSCNKMIEDDYYFHLVFENYLDKDYVTEKILMAVQNFAIPIVFGGADYSRFLPLKSYLDARKLTSIKLVHTMIDIIDNFTLHEQYFRWTNHYSYVAASDLEICNICQALNDDVRVNKRSQYKHFREWWQGTLTVKEMLISIYLKDKDFQQAGSNYRKIRGIMKQKYFPKPTTALNISVFSYTLDKFISTTDSNTIEANTSETTTIDIMNDD